MADLFSYSKEVDEETGKSTTSWNIHPALSLLLCAAGILMFLATCVKFVSVP